MSSPNPAGSNAEIAHALEQVATLLERRRSNPFRVRAYAEAARAIRDLDENLADVLRERGREGLEEIPGIGPSLSRTIEELVTTRRLASLERLQNEASPQALFTLVPGIGPELARRISEGLGIDSLEALEIAASDGRLEGVAGFGVRRARGIREALDTMLYRRGRHPAWRAGPEHSTPAPGTPPPVALLLELDARYREAAAAGTLRKIAPRRFNPGRKAWLPILHEERASWSSTALWSNSPRAHELGTTHDWVVIYCERDGVESQCTVVTASRGPLAGKRVVRGREAECRVHYGI